MPQRVFAAMSGGVDSAAAALLLLQAGYEVTGVTLRLHDFRNRPGLCGSGDDIATARPVAAFLGIPHQVLDLRELFRARVMDRFAAEYAGGRTPNPCIDCNREIKFGALLDWALDQGADAIATGHYARLRQDDSGRWQLLRGADRRKDQTYFLYQLTQRQLAHLRLPVGDYEKPALRALAESHGLINAQKADSQDICFVPDGDYGAFLRCHGGVEMSPGDFVDAEGQVLGRHKGLPCYTIGQRKGLGVGGAEGRLYVLGKDPERNTVILGADSRLYSQELTAERVNWLSIPEPSGPLPVTAKTRYSQREASATVEPLPGGRIHMVFQEPQRAITPGQAVVFYSGDLVLGGGTIC